MHVNDIPLQTKLKMTTGDVFKKHKGGKEQLLFLVAPKSAESLGSIHWCDQGNRKLDSSRCVQIESITDIYIGKQTSALKETNAMATHCFSLVTPKLSLDLEALNEHQRDLWVHGIAAIVDHAFKKAKTSSKLQTLPRLKIHSDPQQGLYDGDYSHAMANGASKEKSFYSEGKSVAQPASVTVSLRKATSIEISLKCRNLFQANGRPVNSLIGLFENNAEKNSFSFLGHTDRVDGSTDPSYEKRFFLTYLGGRPQHMLFSLYDIDSECQQPLEKDRLGSTIVNLADIVCMGLKAEVEFPLHNDTSLELNENLKKYRSCVVVQILKMEDASEVDKNATPELHQTVDICA